MKETTLSTVLRTVLAPSAEYLGQELKNALRAKVEELKENRRADNLRAHLLKTLEELAQQKPTENEETQELPSTGPLMQLELFEQWCDGAQDVGPEEDELARLWQQLLARIVKGEIRSNLLIKKLRDLDAFDAHLLLRFSERGYFRKGSEIEEYHLKQMQAMELVKEMTERWLASLIPLMCGIFGFVYYRVYGIASKFTEASDISSGFKFISEIIPQVGIAIGIGALIGALLFFSLPRWRLTWIGLDLLRHVVTSRDKRQRTTQHL